MKKTKSLIVKMVLVVGLALCLVIMPLVLVVSQLLKEEVLEQWKTKDYKMVQVYTELLRERGCDSVEEYQTFVEEINESIDLNYALFIEDKDGVVTAVAHANKDRIGIELTDAGSIAAARDGEPYVGYFTDEVTGNLTLDVLEPVYDENGTLLGALNLGISVDNATMNKILSGSRTKVLATMAICSIVLLTIMSIVIAVMIINPIKRLAGNISKMANYDLTGDKTGSLQKYTKRQDEIGMISKDFETMRKNIEKLVTEITSVIAELAKQSDSLSNVSTQVAEMGTQLSSTVTDVANGATTQAEETATGQEQVNKLSQLIETVNENMNALNSATKDININKDKGVDALEVVISNTQKNTDNSKKVYEVIVETSNQTERIKEASSQIRDIAEQTNLLALNASIEAARAGDAGKGFAVVATEIGNLANGTNSMTLKIEEIIQDLVKKMELAVSVISEMQESAKLQSDNVSDTNDKFLTIADNIQNMETCCKHLETSTDMIEKSRGVIVEIVSNLSAISEENAACMEEAAASVEEQAKSIETVSASSQNVATLAEKLEKEIKQFVIE